MLAKLEQKYGARGFRVLGFPCNDFANEEPDDLATIKTFCEREYGATYELFDKVHAVGDEIHPLYRYLSEKGEPAGPVKWNFEKFLIGRDGKIVGRFGPKVQPDAPEVLTAVGRALAAPRP